MVAGLGTVAVLLESLLGLGVDGQGFELVFNTLL